MNRFGAASVWVMEEAAGVELGLWDNTAGIE